MPIGIIAINIALLFYTYAVFSARKQGLHFKHLMAFGIGLSLDIYGTFSMFKIQNSIIMNWHTLLGLLSLLGMGLHFMLALIATWLNKYDKANYLFHKISLIIYSLWIISFVTGGIIAKMKI